MASFLSLLLLLLLLVPSRTTAAATSSCTSYTFTTDESFASCTDLPHLNASLHWNYAPKPGTLRVAFRALASRDGWVAWGINPVAAKMAGTQALVAFRHSNGSMVAYSTQLNGYSPAMVPAELSLPVYNLLADYVREEMIIFATLGVWNSSNVNHLWQVGMTVAEDVPKRHPTTGENVKSMGVISFT